MSLQYIIDGYNLINHRLFTITNKKKSQVHRALLELIRTQRLCGSAKNKACVVFDGYPDTALPQFKSDIEIIFAKTQTADERIKRMVENSPCPKNIRVVSDDKEIRFYAGSLGAKVLSIEEFLIRSKDLSKPREEEILKPELTYEEMHKINQELRRIWLK